MSLISSEYQPVYVHASDPETKTEASFSNIWTGAAKPSSSYGKNSEASVNILASEKGAGKNQYDVSMGQNRPVCTSTSHMPSCSSRIIFSGTT
jgi:hypothetical protein